jgi:hypothetical protein
MGKKEKRRERKTKQGWLYKRRCLLNSPVLRGYEHRKGVYQNLEKNSETSFLETVFSRAKCRLAGHKKKKLINKFWNRNCTSLVYFVERNVLQIHIDRNFSQKIHLFHGLSWFASVDWRVLTVLQNWSRSKVGLFYPWNHTEKWISQPIFAGPQSFLDDFRTTFWDLH